jgi:hypothetical protein
MNFDELYSEMLAAYDRGEFKRFIGPHRTEAQLYYKLINDRPEAGDRLRFGGPDADGNWIRARTPDVRSMSTAVEVNPPAMPNGTNSMGSATPAR